MFDRTDTGPENARSIVQITGRHLVLAAVLSTILLTIRCLSENFFDEAYFSRWYVQIETARLARHITLDAGAPVLGSHSSIDYYQNASAPDYGFRIWTMGNDRSLSSNEELMRQVSPVFGEGRHQSPDSWLRKFADPWFHVVGGRRVEVGDASIWIEVATRGDPLRLRYWALLQDFLHDVLIPITPTVFLSALLAWVSLTRALRPVARIVDMAKSMHPESVGAGIPPQGLPKELSVLVGAYNDMLRQVGKLVTSQRQFMGQAAHQLRMPLSIMMLEIDKTEHDFARKLSADLSALGNVVERMLELSRLQALTVLNVEPVDLVELCQAAKRDLQPLIDERDCDVSIIDLGSTSIVAEPIAVREALRNLLSNAVLHNKPRSRVQIACGPGAQLSVEDDGQGLPPDCSHLFMAFARGRTSADGSGLGLAIVKEVMDLHGGEVHAGASELGGAKFTLRFYSAAILPQKLRS